MKFVDEIQITVSSGNGGPGAVSFRRETGMPRGGPDGGDGGKGGDVVFHVNPQISTLLDLRYKKVYQAGHGEKGGLQNMTGASGADLIISIPVGTVIHLEDEDPIDLVTTDPVTLLKGGRGGKGNTFFKTSVNQAPEHAQPGEKGETKKLRLELKLMADVGIIGFPNAGKSTLISRISAARPKIADYPFTTLVPNLGVVRLPNTKTIVVADIPGLVEGAHAGQGLGIQFLRHIERTRCFVHLVDGSEFTEHTPAKAYQIICDELKKYDDTKDAIGLPLSQRKQIVAVTKADSITEDRWIEILKEFTPLGISPILISAISGLGLQELLTAVEKLVSADDAREVSHDG
jgi:GTP-binding protein